MTSVSAPPLSRTSPSLFGRPFRWIAEARDRRRIRSIEQAYRDARLSLGRRMYAAGIDDGETGARIAALTDDSAEAWAQRTRLFIRLADAALEDDAPLPGAEVEFERALELKGALAAETFRRAFVV